MVFLPAWFPGPDQSRFRWLQAVSGRPQQIAHSHVSDHPITSARLGIGRGLSAVAGKREPACTSILALKIRVIQIAERDPSGRAGGVQEAGPALVDSHMGNAGLVGVREEHEIARP
jgi:hypothetical protein